MESAESHNGGTVNNKDPMKRRKWFGYFSKSCALLGGIIGLSISSTVLINIISDRNWSAAPFLLVAVIVNLLILVFNLRSSSFKGLALINGSIGLMQVLFIYLARFSIGIFLIPSTLLVLLAALLDFVLYVTHHDQQQSTLSDQDLISSFINQQNSNQELISNLTSRERQVLVMLVQALSNQEIAQRLFISQNTVRHHVHQILKKLNCSSRTQAAAIGRKEGLNSEVISYQNPKINFR
jgi:RNA polymerase sigma factor (sigma-70 family)